MQGKDEVSIAITFFIGLVAGFYFYLTGFAPQTERIKELYTPTVAETEDFTLEGRQYGGCERNRSCSSFIVRFDGSYSFLPASAGSSIGAETGSLSRAQLRELRAGLSIEQVSLASQPNRSATCAAAIDGIEYRYEVTVAGELYVLDTCTTKVSEFATVRQLLDTVWQWFL